MKINLTRNQMLIAGGALVVAVLVLGRYVFGSSETAAPTVQAVAVATTEATKGRITAANATSGQVEPALSVYVTAKIPGRVTQVHKEMGDVVKAGDLLAEIEDRDASAQLAQARASLAQAEAQRAEAARQYNRFAELLKSGAVSQQQVEQIQTQLSMANAGVEAARASVELATANWERTQITAQADGVLASRTVEPGSMVGAGTALFQLVDLSTLTVKTGVPERDVNAIKPGMTVPVHVPALEREFEGKVEAVSPNMDRQTRSYSVKVTLPNPEGLLKGGMFARVQFPIKEQEGILLPVDAVVERNGETYVYVVENAVAKQQKVTVIATADETVAVEGVAEGAQVVTAGQNRVYDGAPVKMGRSTTP